MHIHTHLVISLFTRGCFSVCVHGCGIQSSCLLHQPYSCWVVTGLVYKSSGPARRRRVCACVCEREYKVQTGALPCISPHTFQNTPEILSGRILMPDQNTSATLLNETAGCFNPKAFFSKGLRVVVSGFWKTDAWFSILSTEP